MKFMTFYLVFIYSILFHFFFFNDTATTEIYTLSLHDALPISGCLGSPPRRPKTLPDLRRARDRKSTRLNSSHLVISYAVFCLKKKKYNQLLAYSHNPNKDWYMRRFEPLAR